MTEVNYLLISQALTYFVSILFSICYFIPMIFNVNDFNGKCILFTTGTFNETDPKIFQPNWSNFSYCGFTIFNGFFISIISLVQLVRMINFMRNRLDSTLISSFWDSLIALIIVIFLLINSILVTVGFYKWCKSITQNFEACEDAADSKNIIFDKTDVYPDWFYLEIGIVQFGVWATLVIWVLILFFSVRKFYLSHERENLIISMARERRRYTKI